MDEQLFRFRAGTHTRGEDTRRRILDAAIEVFAVEGYERASTRLLAERAGVNLPAIQYYFGSKEGLLRAAVEHIAEEIDQQMAPVRARVNALLASRAGSRRDYLDLLLAMLDAFVGMVAGQEQQESRRLFIARAEVERSAAIDVLHERMSIHVGAPCQALVARLIGRSTEDEETVLRTIAILGQVAVFCRKVALRHLGWTDAEGDRVSAIRTVVRQHTEAIFQSGLDGK